MLVTLAVVLIFKTSYTTNFAQGTIATFSAFISAGIVNYKVADATTNIGYTILTILFAAAVGIIVAFLMGVLVDKLLLRKAKFKNPVGTQMITMGLVLFFSGFISFILNERGQYYMSPIIKGVQTLRPSQTIVIDGVTSVIPAISITNQILLTIIVSAVVIAAIFILLRKTSWGLAVRATASNEKVADMMGVNTHFITAVTWGLAGAIGGLAAILWAPIKDPNQAINIATLMIGMQIDAFLALVVGGVTTFFGPVVVAGFIPILRGVLNHFLSKGNLGSWKNAILYVIILLVVLNLPNGIFGKKQIKKV